MTILLVIGCNKYRAWLDAAIRRFQRPGVWRVVGVIANPSLSEATFDETIGLLTVPVSDNYENLPKKMWCALTWCLDRWPDTPGIFKTDDDMLIDLAQLEKTIKRCSAIDYWGLVTDTCSASPVNKFRIEQRCENKSIVAWHQAASYCFGWGYWLSPRSLRVVRDAKQEYWRSMLEDVCLGSVLNAEGIFPEHQAIAFKECPRTPELLTIS